MEAGARSLRQLVVLLALVASLAGCAGTRVAAEWPDPGPGATTMVRSELYFGRSKPDGSRVTEEQWRAFVAEHVTPRFPDGLTILDAVGQYRMASGQIVREPSQVVLILHDGGERSRAAIREVRALYRKLFDQESVLLISSPARVSFGEAASP